LQSDVLSKYEYRKSTSVLKAQQASMQTQQRAAVVVSRQWTEASAGSQHQVSTLKRLQPKAWQDIRAGTEDHSVARLLPATSETGNIERRLTM